MSGKFLGACLIAALLIAGKSGFDVGTTTWVFAESDVSFRSSVKGLDKSKASGDWTVNLTFDEQLLDGTSVSGTWSAFVDDALTIGGTYARKSTRSRVVALTLDGPSALAFAAREELAYEAQLPDGVDVEFALAKSKLRAVLRVDSDGKATASLRGALVFTGTADGAGVAAAKARRRVGLVATSTPVDATMIVVPSASKIAGDVRTSSVEGDDDAPIPGLARVADGTPVSLVRLDDLGIPTQTLTETTVKDGRYTFTLGKLGVDLASDLAVVVQTPGVLLRALAVGADTDVDPLAEASTALVLSASAGLSGFRAREVDDLRDSVTWLAAAQGLEAALDDATTIATIRDAALAKPTLVEFLGDAAATGQTMTGPGDVGEVFPTSLGDTWVLEGTFSVGGSPGVYEAWRRVDAVDGAIEKTYDSPYGKNGTVEELVEKTGARVTVTRDIDELLLDLPYERARFPLRLGDRLVTEYDDVTLPDQGEDAIPETGDVRIESTVAAIEDVSVPAGDYPGCVRFDLDVRATLVLTGVKGKVKVRLLRREWYAPGRGLVRVETERVETGAFGKFDEDFTGKKTRATVEVLRSWRVGDEGQGVLPGFEVAADVAPPTSSTTDPGPPAISYDGTNHFVVSRRTLTLPQQIVGILVSPSGEVLQEIVIATGMFASQNWNLRSPDVVFDGQNHVVVFDEGADAVYAVRVSPEGVVLDPERIVIAEAGFSASVGGAAASYDGDRTLVIWSTEGETRGRFFESNGALSSPFTIATGKTFLDVDHGAGNHVVVWRERVGDWPLDTWVVGASRVSTDGIVLDPDGVVLTDGLPGERGDYEAWIHFADTHFLLSWMRIIDENWDEPVLALRVDPDLTPLDAEAVEIATNVTGRSGLVSTFHQGVHWIVWTVDKFNSFSSGFEGGVHAARLSTEGELVDGPTTPLSTMMRVAPFASTLKHSRVSAASGTLFHIWNFGSGSTKNVYGGFVFSLD